MTNMADYTVNPMHLKGTAHVPPSKSILHRELIAIALTTLNTGRSLADVLTSEACEQIRKAGEDAVATYDSLGAVTGEKNIINCNESGTTLRLMLPVLAALGREVEIELAEGLARRPIGELADELSRHGCSVERSDNGRRLVLKGRLTPGSYCIPGNISSQYISGLLMALPLLNGPSTLTVKGRPGSKPYIDMTLEILKNSGITVVEREAVDAPEAILNQDIIYDVYNDRRYSLDTCSFEPDWSAAAFWKVAEFIDPQSRIEIPGLKYDSCQGDSRVVGLLKRMADHNNGSDNLSACEINLDDTPDLLPPLAIAACATRGACVFTGIERLKFKESNRIESVLGLIEELGGAAEVVSAFKGSEALVVHGVGRLRANTVKSRFDHRIAMSAAIASLISDGQMHVTDGQCTAKSYPDFWNDFYTLQQNN